MTRPNDHPTPEDLSAYIDGELDRARRHALEAHVSGCAACRTLVDDLETLRLVQGADVPPAVPAGLAAKVGARLDAVAPARRAAPRPRRWMRPVLAAAATIVIGTVVTVIVTQQREERFAPALRTPAAPSTEPPAAPSAAPSAAPAEKPRQQAAPAPRSADETRDKDAARSAALEQATSARQAPADQARAGAERRNEVDRLEESKYAPAPPATVPPPPPPPPPPAQPSAAGRMADAKKEAPAANRGIGESTGSDGSADAEAQARLKSLGYASSEAPARADQGTAGGAGGEVAVPVVLAPAGLAKGAGPLANAPAAAPGGSAAGGRAKASAPAPVVWSAPDTDVLWQRLVGFVEGAGGRVERTAAGRTLWVPREKLPQLMQWLARQGASGVPQNAAPGVRIELRESGRS